MIRGLENRISDFHKSYKINPNTSCYEWTEYISPQGYGFFSVMNKQKMTHRIAWEWANEKEIPKGMCICHHCDNRKCVNPSHLFLGTRDDNNKDMTQKGRHVGAAKLKPYEVLEILKSNETGEIISRRFKISSSQVYSIRLGKEWNRVTGLPKYTPKGKPTILYNQKRYSLPEASALLGIHPRYISNTATRWKVSHQVAFEYYLDKYQ